MKITRRVFLRISSAALIAPFVKARFDVNAADLPCSFLTVDTTSITVDSTINIAAVIDLDCDADGVPLPLDNCPEQPNADQADADGNGVGDVCEPPRVTGVWTSTPAAIGQTLSLFVFGGYFDLTPGATQVSINGIQQSIVQSVTPEMLIVRVTVTPDMIGGPVTVTTSKGSANSATSFGTPLSGVNVTGVWPATASAGDFVFVFGSGYVFPMAVRIGATPVPLVQVVTSEMFIMIVPPGASSGPVAVATTSGSASSTEHLIIVP
jgi:hypothetical protein